MKMNKKKVLVSAVAVCLIAILSAGTLAWFQAKDEVTNIFKVSTDGEQKPDFKLSLYETEVISETGGFGDADEDGTVEEVEANTYENIAPGDVLAKDPTVRNDGQYDQWVRIKITLEDYAAWEAILGDGYNFKDILTNVSTDWSYDSFDATTGTLVYYKNTKLTVGSSSTLFTAVTIPAEFTEVNMPTAFNLDIVAEAIQADNTGDSAKAAFSAYWENR